MFEYQQKLKSLNICSEAFICHWVICETLLQHSYKQTYSKSEAEESDVLK